MKILKKLVLAKLFVLFCFSASAGERYAMVNYVSQDDKPFLFSQLKPVLFTSKIECEQELIRVHLVRESQATRVVRDTLVIAEGLGGALVTVKACVLLEDGGW